MILLFFSIGFLILFSGLIGLTQKVITDGISIGLTLSSKPNSVHDSFEQMNLKDTLISGFSYLITFVFLGSVSGMLIFQGLDMQEFQCEGYPGNYHYDAQWDTSWLSYGDYVSFSIDGDLVGNGMNDCEYWFEGSYNSIYIDQLEPGIIFSDENIESRDNLGITSMGYLFIMLGLMVLLCTFVGFITKLVADTIGTGFELHERGKDKQIIQEKKIVKESNMITKTLHSLNFYLQKIISLKDYKSQNVQSEIDELKKEIIDLKKRVTEGNSTDNQTSTEVKVEVIAPPPLIPQEKIDRREEIIKKRPPKPSFKPNNKN